MKIPVQIAHRNYLPNFTIINPEADERIRDAIRESPNNTLVKPPTKKTNAVSASVNTFGRPEALGCFALEALIAPFDMIPNGIFLVIGLTSVTLAGIQERNKNRRRQTIASNTQGMYIRTEWLTDRAMQLVRRAKDTCDTALGTQVVRDGKLDGQISVEFPALVWDIAKILLDVSQIQAEIATSNNPALERKILREALDKVTGRMAARVAAMESCAANVAEADRRYRAMLPADQGGNIDSRILNLMISTQSEGSEQVESITQDAQIVAESYRQAMDTALDSLNTLLEPR